MADIGTAAGKDWWTMKRRLRPWAAVEREACRDLREAGEDSAAGRGKSLILRTSTRTREAVGEFLRETEPCTRSNRV